MKEHQPEIAEWEATFGLPLGALSSEGPGADSGAAVQAIWTQLKRRIRGDDVRGMQDRIQPVALFLIRKNNSSQPGTIEGAVGRENIGSKSLYHRSQAGCARRHDVPGGTVSIQNPAAKLAKDTKHERLSNRNRSGKANLQHKSR